MATITEDHPYNSREAIPERTRLLIVGTAPPPRFSKSQCRGSPHCKCRDDLDFDFFYGSGKNYMWQFLGIDIAKEIEGYSLFTDKTSDDDCCRAARAFLQRHGIWMRDVLQAWHRRVECSSEDKDIVPEKFIEFESVFRNESLLAVACTSEQAAKWTLDALDKQGFGNHQAKLGKWKEGKIGQTSRKLDIEAKYQRPFFRLPFGQRHVEFYVLPSPANTARWGGMTLCEKLSIYRNVLFLEHPRASASP
jgi:G:T/U-mismatch repair DNA glycosylase